MILEIFNVGGDRLEWTDHPEHPKCMPSKDEFQAKQQNGLEFKLNGKVMKTYDALVKAVAKGK